MVRLVHVQRGLGHGGNLSLPRVLHDGHATALLDLSQAARAIAVGAGKQHCSQMGAVRIGGRFEQVIDGGSLMMQPRLQAQRIAAVPLH